MPTHIILLLLPFRAPFCSLGRCGVYGGTLYLLYCPLKTIVINVGKCRGSNVVVRTLQVSKKINSDIAQRFILVIPTRSAPCFCVRLKRRVTNWGGVGIAAFRGILIRHVAEDVCQAKAATGRQHRFLTFQPFSAWSVSVRYHGRNCLLPLLRFHCSWFLHFFDLMFNFDSQYYCEVALKLAVNVKASDSLVNSSKNTLFAFH